MQTLIKELGSDEDRLLFEQCIRRQFGDDESLERNSIGMYVNDSWQGAYIGWRLLRDALSAEAQVPIDIMPWQERIDEDAERYGRSEIKTPLYFAKEEISDLRNLVASYKNVAVVRD